MRVSIGSLWVGGWWQYLREMILARHYYCDLVYFYCEQIKVRSRSQPGLGESHQLREEIFIRPTSIVMLGVYGIPPLSLGGKVHGCPVPGCNFIVGLPAVPGTFFHAFENPSAAAPRPAMLAAS